LSTITHLSTITPLVNHHPLVNHRLLVNHHRPKCLHETVLAAAWESQTLRSLIVLFLERLQSVCDVTTAVLFLEFITRYITVCYHDDDIALGKCCD